MAEDNDEGLDRLVKQAQLVASNIDALLEAVAGEPVAFVISLVPDGRQGIYLTNLNTEDAVMVMEGSLRQIRAKQRGGRSDGH